MENIKRSILTKVQQNQPKEFIEAFYSSENNNVFRDEQNLKEFINLLTEQQQNSLWEALSRHVITATINEAASATFTEHTPNVSQAGETDKESLAILKCVLKLAQATISLKECGVPKTLYQSVLLIHDYVLSSDHGELKKPLVSLCETWWRKNIEGRESLVFAPLMYNMDKCLTKRPTAKVVQSLHSMRQVLGAIDVTNGKMIWDMVLNLFANYNFLKVSKAQKFLSHAMLSQPSLLKRIHQTIKYGLSQCGIVIARIYGSITLAAWASCEDEAVKQVIEMDIIQDIMYNAVNIMRISGKSLHTNLMNYLSEIHSKRNPNPDVNRLLVKLYKPFLWRSMHVPNPEVRANATQLFLDAFPLVDVAGSRRDCEELIQKQFDLIVELLVDDYPVVRQAAATGVCQVLSNCRNRIPDEVIADLLTILFTKLAWDQASADVRVAALQGLSLLLDDHENYRLLTPILPTLSDLFHDKSEKVRLTFAKLLVKIKHIRAFNVWKIIEKEHLLSRLEMDSRPVCLQLVELIYKSFINDDLDNNKQLECCIALIESGLERARRFYRYAVGKISLQQAVKYMLLLRKCIITCVNKQRDIDKENRPTLSTTLANMTLSNATTLSNFTLMDNNITQLPKERHGSLVEDDEELSIHDTCIMRGMFDVIATIWTGVQKQLDMAANAELRDLLHGKFSRALVQCFPTFKDEGIQTSLLYIASMLPADSASALRTDALRRFNNLPTTVSKDGKVCSTLVLCLCQWGCTDQLLQQLYKWSSHIAGVRISRRSSMAGQADASLDCVVQVLSFILSHSVCASKLKENSSLVDQLYDRLANVQAIIRRCLNTSRTSGYGLETLVALLTTFNKLGLVLHQADEDKLLAHMKELCSTVINHCINHMKPGDEAESLSQTMQAKRPRKLIDLQETVLSPNDSVATIEDANELSMVKDLSVQTVRASLTAITNYLMVQTLSSDALRLFSALFNHTDVLCAAGQGLTSAVHTLLIELTNAASVSDACCTTRCDEMLSDSWSFLITTFFSNLHDVKLFSGKAKASWLNLLQCTDLLAAQVQQRIAEVLVTCMLSALDKEDMTPTLKDLMKSTMGSLKPFQQQIEAELQAKNECCQQDSTQHTNIQVLAELLTAL